jgi:hypothetical protein
MPLDGYFLGMEEIKKYEPGEKWFHEDRLLIRDGQAVLDKVPLRLLKGGKQYSHSDGGFITYRGRFFLRDQKLFISLRPFESMYIVFLRTCEPYSKVTVFPVQTTSGNLEFEGVLYHPATFSKEIGEQLALKLRNEPMEYTGTRPYFDQKLPVCQ